MKKSFFIPFLLVALAFAFAACEETTEPGAYDNWRERNDAFIDSIRTETGENYLVWRNPATRVTTDLGQTPMELGKLYAIEVQDGGTSAGLEYTYAKKLVDNPDGTRLLATDYVEMFYACWPRTTWRCSTGVLISTAWSLTAISTATARSTRISPLIPRR